MAVSIYNSNSNNNDLTLQMVPVLMIEKPGKNGKNQQREVINY